MLIHGGCRCANIAFDFRWDPDPTRFLRALLLLVLHQAWRRVDLARRRLTSHPYPGVIARIRVLLRHTDRGVSRLLCCGVAPVVTSQIDDHLYAVVNVNAFEK